MGPKENSIMEKKKENKMYLGHISKGPYSDFTVENCTDRKNIDARIAHLEKQPHIKCVVGPFLALNVDEAIITLKNIKMDYFKQVGQHLGYPECCTDWFSKRFLGEVAFDLTAQQEVLHDNNGFIPCPECAAKVITTPGMKIDDLIQNRAHHKAYPEDDADYIIKHFQ